MHVRTRITALLIAGVLAACSGEPTDFSKLPASQLTKVRTDRTYFRDEHGRYLYWHGVNLGCDTKLPFAEPPDAPAVTFVGKPFPLTDAERWFGDLSRHGFNVVRLIMNWEAIEHEGPGIYDTEYLDFLAALVDEAGRHGIYVLMDMHQDIFSRHLHVKFNSEPSIGEPGSVEWMLFSTLPHADGAAARDGTWDNRVAGHGAPRWVVQTCLPEKKLDSPNWGIFRPLGGIFNEIQQLIRVLQALLPDAEPPSWLPELINAVPLPFGIDESSDFMPWGFWGMNMALSVDMERCTSAFFAGRRAWPDWLVDDAGQKLPVGQTEGGRNIQDFLQERFVGAWMQVVERVRDKPNVVGYDLLNEPPGLFIALAAIAIYFDTGLDTAVRDALGSMTDPDAAPGSPTLGEDLWELLVGLGMIPPDTTDETRRAWGLEGFQTAEAVALNIGFDEQFLQPFYEKVGSAIVEADPSAVLWIERAAGLSLLQAPGGFQPYESFMTWPRDAEGERLPQVVYAPHWYPDIYPEIGFNTQPRTRHADQVKHQDFTDKIREGVEWSQYALSNAPVVFGEFGTYFNFNVPRLRGVSDEDLRAQMEEKSYPVSAEMLDNYYEAFEANMVGHMQWCFSANASYRYGEGWNNEDFSVIDPRGEPRASTAWSRPYARAMAGKPVHMHFHSDHHYFDPDKGEVDPLHEFVLEHESRETDAPTEVFVPDVQYPEGFYVWLSDGYATFDPDRRILHWYPTRDEPGFIHRLRLLPPRPGAVNEGWSYFVRGGHTVNGTGR